MGKKLVAGAMAGIVVVSLVSAVSLSAGYARQIPRHKDPARIREEAFFPIQLVLIYARVIALQVSEKWDAASSELKRAFRAYLPESVRYIFTRFNQLIQATGDKLRSTKVCIDEAAGFRRIGEIEKAERKLNTAWMTLLKAERDIESLKSATGELEKKIGGEAGGRLREEISSLERLAHNYREQIQRLYRKVTEEERLAYTRLRIDASPREVKVGESLEIWGQLIREGGEGLEGRWVELLLEGKKAGEVPVGQDGRFRLSRRLPFLYQESVYLLAVYEPQGEDTSRFYPARSKEINLKPLYYSPLIEVSYQSPIYPTWPFEVWGEVKLKDKVLTDYPVEIEGPEGTTLTTTNDEGKFRTALCLPSWVGERAHLRFTTPSRGIVGPGSLALELPVTRKIPRMTVDLPRMVIVPFPLKVNGRVSVPGEELAKARVGVIMGEGEFFSQLREGEFQASTDISLFRFSGWERLRVLFEPGEAWISPLSREGRVLVANPLTLLPFAILFLVFIRVTRTGGSRKTEEGEERAEREVLRERESEEGELAPIVRMYLEAVRVVSRITGIEQRPECTIREYLRLVEDKLKGLTGKFEYISLTTERFLYSAVGVGEEELNTVREVVNQLKTVRRKEIATLRSQ